ncbi:hypothetical protein CCMSSC00406_0009572 [Pleurotus cornucopiae]|uniref:Uncharacterized protein n=1 Tax=Pleurotus cornucopiae TaxID=5321 RepID=A0ACB7IWW8_PLECO|nr:hypothetical protein CCMSSC00406_0009572 [Pleurotus cornucopiae]
MKKSLTPPPGTLYHQLKQFDIYDNEVVVSNFTLTWQAEIHVYVAGGIKPDDPDFEAKGGAIYVVVCHTGSLEVAEKAYGDLTFVCGIDDADGRPYLHFPLSNAFRKTDDPKAVTYSFDFSQTFQMLKDNAPLSFNAQYSIDFTLGWYTGYYTNLNPGTLRATFKLAHHGLNESVTDHNVHGVSGFRLTKPRKQINMWFCIGEKGDFKNVTIDLGF